jgi:hypothetical protein
MRPKPQPSREDPQLKIDAMPTKDLFISMLTKDIPLSRAIIDLVDNSIDGALRSRPNGNFEGLEIRLEVKPDHFQISDNCGGMSIETAQHYAFRFGRPDGMEPTQHSVGQFGVGMKRSLFKLGNLFRISSISSKSRFQIEVDVKAWKEIEEWAFDFNSVERKSFNQDQWGTVIGVYDLHPSVSTDFGLDNFVSRLGREIEEAHIQSITKGIAITLNGIPVNVKPLELIRSSKLQPAYRELSAPEIDSDVNVKIYAGIANSDPRSGGWYVFCNGRLILGPDQTIITGWGEGGETTIPKYHNQFAMFRGYTFFESDNTSLLPWNTTKTGVDTDSPLYKRVRVEMITLMRPVIDFLNKLKEEREGDGPTQLDFFFTNQDSVQIGEISTQQTFQVPQVVRQPPTLGKISYSKPMEEIDRVKKVLRVSTYKDVGEKTFEYFMHQEVDE